MLGRYTTGLPGPRDYRTKGTTDAGLRARSRRESRMKELYLEVGEINPCVEK